MKYLLALLSLILWFAFPTDALGQIVPVSRGGLGASTTPANGQVLMGSTTVIMGVPTSVYVPVATSSLGISGGGGEGTVTSVGLSVPTGLTVSGSPITNSGTLILSLAPGYVIPLTASTTNWQTAFGWGNHTSAGYITDGNTLWDNSYNLFDKDTDDTGYITEGSKLFYTDDRARAAISENAAGLIYTAGVLDVAGGYEIPRTASTTNWQAAFGWGNHASAGYILDGNTGWDNSYNLFNKDIDDTGDITEGGNLFYTLSRFASAFAGTTTDALPEGSTRKYYTDARVGAYVSGSSTIPHKGGTAYGNLLVWTGTGWDVTATSGLKVSWNDLANVPAGFADGTDDTGGGGTASPGGPSTAVQYNDGGTLGGEAGFEYNKTTNTLTAGLYSLASRAISSWDEADPTVWVCASSTFITVGCDYIVSGAADDEVQDAIEDFEATTEGGIPQLTPGVFEFDNPVVITKSKGMGLRGAGDATILRAGTSMATSSYMIQTNSTSDGVWIALSDFKIEAQCETSGILVQGGIQSTIDHVWIHEPYRWAVAFTKDPDMSGYGHNNKMSNFLIDNGSSCGGNGGAIYMHENDENSIAFGEMQFNGGSSQEYDQVIVDRSGLNKFTNLSVVHGKGGIRFSDASRSIVSNSVFDRNEKDLIFFKGTENQANGNLIYQPGYNGNVASCFVIDYYGESTIHGNECRSSATDGETEWFLKQVGAEGPNAGKNSIVLNRFYTEGTLSGGLENLTTEDNGDIRHSNIGLDDVNYFVGSLVLSGSSQYFNFSSTHGSTGFGFRNNGGTLEFKNSGGSWTAIGSGGGGMTWNTTTGTTESASGANGYVPSNASQVVYTLPATAATGTSVKIGGLGSGGFKVLANSGQTIRYATTSTTVGVESTNRYDYVEFVAVQANTFWKAVTGDTLAVSTAATFYSLDFDGTNDKAQIADSSALEGLSEGTVEFWFRTGYGAGYQKLYKKAGVIDIGITQNFGGGAKLFAEVSGMGNLGDFGPSVADNTWRHFALTWDVGGDVLAFIDGVQVDTVPSTGSQGTGSSPIYVGHDNGSEFFNGDITDIRVSDVQRYTTTFTPPEGFTTDADTLALYEMTEGSGSTVADGSGNGHTLTLDATNPPAWSSARPY